LIREREREREREQTTHRKQNLPPKARFLSTELVRNKKIIEINSKQSVVVEELGKGKEGERCLINNCQDNNLFPSPLCLGHTAGALDYLEDYGRQKRTKKWVKEQKNRVRLAKCADEIARILEIIRVGERELKALKSKLERNSYREEQYFTEAHTEFLQFDKEGNFSFKISQQKVPPPDYREKEQEY
jgi:hypothetical protein